MSVSRFTPSSHPQQLALRGVASEVDRRFTPREWVERLHAQHRFTLDACSEPLAPSSSVIGRWFGRQADGSWVDGLEESWAGERVFANIPFSDCPAWVDKAWREERSAAVLWMPANRTEQGWWQEKVEPYRDRLGGELTTEFLPARIGYGVPWDPENLRNCHEDGRPRSSPQFGAVLLRFRCGGGR